MVLVVISGLILQHSYLSSRYHANDESTPLIVQQSPVAQMARLIANNMIVLQSNTLEACTSALRPNGKPDQSPCYSAELANATGFTNSSPLNSAQSGESDLLNLSGSAYRAYGQIYTSVVTMEVTTSGFASFTQPYALTWFIPRSPSSDGGKSLCFLSKAFLSAHTENSRSATVISNGQGTFSVFSQNTAGYGTQMQRETIYKLQNPTSINFVSGCPALIEQIDL